MQSNAETALDIFARTGADISNSITSILPNAMIARILKIIGDGGALEVCLRIEEGGGIVRVDLVDSLAGRDVLAINTPEMRVAQMCPRAN